MKASEPRTYYVGRKTSLEELSKYLGRLGAMPSDAISLLKGENLWLYSVEHRMRIENLKITFQDRVDGKYATIAGKYVEQAKCNRKVDGMWYPGGEIRENFSYTAKVPTPITTISPDSPLPFRQLGLEEIADFDAQFERDSNRTLLRKACDWLKQLVA